MVSTAKVTASAAQFVDSKLETAANAVDRFANIVNATTGNADGTSANNFGEPITRRLSKTATQLRSQNGDAIIDGIKNQMLQNPKATIGIAAAAGAIAAQAALMLFKSEQSSQELTLVDAAPGTKGGPKKPRKAKAAVNNVANDDDGQSDDLDNTDGDLDDNRNAR